MRAITIMVSIFFFLEADLFACATADLISRLSRSGGEDLILIRPDMQHSWATPDGIFRIHYDTEGPRAVYHPDEDIDPLDGIPDYVNRLSEFMALSYQVYIVELGYDPPPFDGQEGGDSLYDIYITEVPALTSPESPSDQYPGRPAYTSYIQLGRDMRTPRYPDDPYPFLKVSAAHEYFHAVQFAYRAYSTDVTPWWFESCAAWAEEMVFDDVNDVYYDLPDYLPQLHLSLYQTEGLFMYGAWLFPQFLSEKIGPWIIRRCWEKFASFSFAMEAIGMAFDEFELDFNDEYCHHVVWNYFTGPNYHSGFYEEAAYFDETVYEARIHYSFPVEWMEQPIDQQNVSGVYINFQKPQISKGNLVIEYFNPTDDDQSVCVAAIRYTYRVEYEIYKVQNRVHTTFTVQDFAECEKVIMMPVWRYEGHSVGGTTSYSYRAYIDSNQTSIPDGYAGPAEFELKGAFPNPFNSSVSIVFDAPAGGEYGMRIYDINGRLILKHRGWSDPGLNRLNWIAPEDLAGGVLFYEVELGSSRRQGKMLYLK